MRSAFVCILTASCILASCKLDDPQEISTYEFLSGAWSLVNVAGGFAGVDDDFEEGVITWTFNPANQTVLVENQNTEPVLMDILPSGTYSFEIVEREGLEELVVNDQNLGIIDCVDLHLVHVDQRAVDGVAITFSR